MDQSCIDYNQVKVKQASTYFHVTLVTLVLPYRCANVTAYPQRMRKGLASRTGMPVDEHSVAIDPVSTERDAATWPSAQGITRRIEHAEAETLLDFGRMIAAGIRPAGASSTCRSTLTNRRSPAVSSVTNSNKSAAAKTATCCAPISPAATPPSCGAITSSSRRSKRRSKISRAIYHQKEARIEAHIFIAFLAYCLHVTLAQQLRPHAPGLTPRHVLEKFAAAQMIDVEIPTTDGRTITLTRHTEPEPELKLLLERLRLELPAQPPPKITTAQVETTTLV
jgi:hypothetical protein